VGVRPQGPQVAASAGKPRRRTAARHGMATQGALAGVLLGMALSSGTPAATDLALYVDASSTCTTSCGSQAAPFSTIQAAIDQANSEIVAGIATSATIHVAAGTYLERLFIYPDVNLIGAGAGSTILDATGLGRSGVIFASGGTGRPRTDFSITGFTITGGSGLVQSTQGTIAGGGIFIFGDAAVTNNAIVGNVLSGSQQDWLGAGVYIGYGRPIIAGNTIADNVTSPPAAGGSRTAYGLGGGVFSLDTFSSPQVIGNRIHDNVAIAEIARGGGMRIRGGPGTVISRNIIYGNRASFTGGGISGYDQETISGNLIYGNSAALRGGGIDLFDATAVVTLNTIVGNTVTNTAGISGYPFVSMGAGVYSDSTLRPPNNPPVRITNNLIYGNSVTSVGAGAGLFSYYSFPLTTNNLFFGDIQIPSTTSEVAGDYSPAQILGVNGNLSADPALAAQPRFFDVTVAAGTTTTVAVLDVSRYHVNDVLEYDNDGIPRTITSIVPATLTLTFTPALPTASLSFKMLADWGAGSRPPADFHLTPHSPAIDAGTNSDLAPVDIDGNPRPVDGNGDGTSVVDIGAYEFQIPDTDGDGVPDAQDCAPLVNSVWSAPGPVGATLLAGGGSPFSLSWTKVPQANVYNLYRGTISGAFSFNHGCFQPASPDLTVQDASLPPIGSAFYYLISAVNSCAESCLGLNAAACEIPPGSPICFTIPGGIPTTDSDGDTVYDINDNCPRVANPTQADQDRDTVGDACDNCLSVYNPNQIDADRNGIGDRCQDLDHDGYTPDAQDPTQADCNDNNPAVHPGALEVCNGIDDDCNGLVDDGLGISTCGVGACVRTVNNCLNGTPQTCVPGSPTPEVCNGIDDDCNGLVDDGLPTFPFYRDVDGDGYGNSATAVQLCGPLPGYVATGGDCNDSDPTVWGTPSEVQGDQFTDAATFAWSAPAAPGATTILYDVLRSTTPTDFVTAATCVATGSAATSLTDASTPLVGQAFFYLVRADDTCPSGQGSLGTSSAGTARSGRSCP